jgi:hypothetical protein
MRNKSSNEADREEKRERGPNMIQEGRRDVNEAKKMN